VIPLYLKQSEKVYILSEQWNLHLLLSVTVVTTSAQYFV